MAGTCLDPISREILHGIGEGVYNSPRVTGWSEMSDHHNAADLLVEGHLEDRPV